jgi:hypothetical protein
MNTASNTILEEVKVGKYKQSNIHVSNYNYLQKL